MYLKLISRMLVTFYVTNSFSHVRATDDEGDASAINSSYYSTREVGEKCLKEWAGKTKEVQEYFDQIPSEEFKEDSDTLKLMHYYEKKGVKNIDTNQVYNITPQVREPMGPEYTIEVNDSYVPKYRVSPSEEIRMEKYGTFNSEPDSSEHTAEGTTEGIITTGPPPLGEKKPGGKKRRRPKPWPPNMDPKGKIRRRKKKSTVKPD